MKHLAFIISIIFLLVGCARQSSPSGGPKDETPAKVLEALPAKNATNSKPDKIVLTFDEYVKLEDLDTQLIISPYSEEKPKIFLKGKNLIIKLPENLEDNTTYSYNFRNAIKDITEGNASENLTYVFSTGNQLDSMMINGVVFNALTGEKVENALVMLHDNLETDSAIYNLNPRYIARTDVAGEFQFNSLPDKQFKIYALVENNSTLMFDHPEELIAFSTEPIQPVDSISKKVKLYLFEEERELYIEKTNQSTPGIVTINLGGKADLEQISVKELDNKEIRVKKHSSDSLKVYFNPLINNKVELLFDDENLQDTIKVELSEEIEMDSIAKIYKSAKTNKIQLNKALKLQTDFPIQNIVPEKLLVIESDSINAEVEVVKGNTNQISINYEWNEETKYQIILQDSFLVDLLNRPNKADTLQFFSAKASDYANIQVNLQGKDSLKYYYVDLIDEKSNLIESINAVADSVVFENIFSGIYNIKVLEDANGNGVYDSGQVLEQKLPENYFLLSPKPFKLKGNVDQEIDFTIF